jgi:hypothetical protein
MLCRHTCERRIDEALEMMSEVDARAMRDPACKEFDQDASGARRARDAISPWRISMQIGRVVLNATWIRAHGRGEKWCRRSIPSLVSIRCLALKSATVSDHAPVLMVVPALEFEAVLAPSRHARVQIPHAPGDTHAAGVGDCGVHGEGALIGAVGPVCADRR